MFNQGAAAPRKLLVFDSTGVAANCTLMVYTVTQPDGTPVVTNPVTPFATGDYRVNGPTAQAGRHLESWVGTGTNATAMPDQYDVRSSVSAALLSLTDAKAVLNIPDADHSQDDEIRDKLDGVTTYIESLVGYVIPQTVTRTMQLSGSAAFLPGPVISVTSITPVLTNGWVYTAADFATETSGLLTRLDGVGLSGQWYTVVYQAGMPGPVNPVILDAARLFMQDWWTAQRGPDQRATQGPGETSLERQALDKLLPFRIVSVA